MGIDQLATGVAMWMCLVALLSFHEFGHAWMAYKCGDDTARIMGRMTINPIVHIDPIGTVLIPLAILWLNPGFFIFGWAKPVPVNPNNYENRKRDDILISMAGPAMNVILAILLMAVYRLALELPIDVGAGAIVHNLELVAFISMILCVFNLIPIPPLDGSHVMRHVVGMSEETYLKIAQYGFIILLIAINVFPQLFRFVGMVSIGTIELFKTVLLFQ
ncbi:MAG: site-2 protease family protein [Verrucomicrobiota bacterium]|nr:site-2 protease family protein [Verrucomicrobiota bacterium]